MDSLDLKSLLGEALGSLTEQLGIDIKSELTSPNNKMEMQAILASSMAELASNMAELDEKSKELYAQLDTLQADLQRETSDFEEKKQEELEVLLEKQSKYTRDFTKSAINLQAKTDDMERLLKDMDENGDYITALALFPLKPNDKKVAFIIGLALAFKVPFDLLQLIEIRSTDLNDYFTLAVQAGLCVATLHYYGLIQAIFRKGGIGIGTGGEMVGKEGEGGKGGDSPL